MTAYILRRILLIIPTMFGIMLVTFVIVQFAPGGPVERLIAQLTGTDPGATTHVQRRRRRCDRTAAWPRRHAGRRIGAVQISRRARARPRIHQEPGEAVRLRQAGLCALRHDDQELSPVRFRPELFPRHQRAEADRREDAGIDLARAVDDAALLRHLDSARHSQGGARRLALRRMDEYGDRDRLCHSRLPRRRVPDRAARRRLVRADLPVARAGLGELARAAPGR